MRHDDPAVWFFKLQALQSEGMGKRASSPQGVRTPVQL
jgi:hypothetical protein